ncbi:hypothetical protein NONO_c03320 [Nocardia nova SH22a]|uniref:Uncharacterized protein n=1 Tax=Nocardia nova SH22a TaxID=1415166 RepID=W5T7G3_9NOCA|nr:hypothetical protein NONO_c03320 [Nocardia nova SH22a]
MTPELPQRVPGVRTAPTVSGDPNWYAAVARALRATPSDRFPRLADTAPGWSSRST